MVKIGDARFAFPHLVRIFGYNSVRLAAIKNYKYLREIEFFLMNQAFDESSFDDVLPF